MYGGLPGYAGVSDRLQTRAGEEAVAVPARLADEDDGDLQPRPRYEAGGDPVAKASVGTAQVADEGDARLQREARVLGSLERPPADGSRQHLRHVDRREGDVIVTVEDSGQQPEAGEVERRRVARRQALSHVRDPAVLDPHVERAAEAAAGVEHVCLAQHVLLGRRHGDSTFSASRVSSAELA